jgi:hypothetical protein
MARESIANRRAPHHHLMEYLMSVSEFSERFGTALINGSCFIRSLKSFAARAVGMHDHRHIDWIGACGKLTIITALPGDWIFASKTTVP